MKQKIGDRIDQLGVLGDLRDDDLIVDALVICKVIDPGGKVSVLLSPSESMSWLDQLGLITAARGIVEYTEYSRADDDD